jgi:hypothetical protein
LGFELEHATCRLFPVDLLLIHSINSALANRFSYQSIAQGSVQRYEETKSVSPLTYI